MNIIAIDCGASFIKAALFSDMQLVKQSEYKTGKPGNKLENTLEMVVQAINEFTKISESNDFFLAISNEMHGFVVADSDGKPFLDYVSWQDEKALLPYKRGNSYVDYVKDLLGEAIALDTGMPIKAGLPNVNLFYYLDTELSDIPTSEIWFYTLGDYIIRRISGNQPYIHPTNAAGTGLYSIIEHTWSNVILSKLGLENINFPAISETGVVSFEYRNNRFTVLPALGDQQAALLGGNCSINELSINIGTGGQVSVLCNEPTLSKHYQTRPFFDGKYIKTVPHIPSGRALNVYYRFVSEIVLQFSAVTDDDIWGRILCAAKASDKSLGVDLSFFTNAITSTRTGSIFDISEDNFSVGALFRSAFMQISENIRECADRIIPVENVVDITATGGLIRKNDLLTEFVKGQFPNANLRISKTDTLYGLALYAKSIGEPLV